MNMRRHHIQTESEEKNRVRSTGVLLDKISKQFYSNGTISIYFYRKLFSSRGTRTTGAFKCRLRKAADALRSYKIKFRSCYKTFCMIIVSEVKRKLAVQSLQIRGKPLLFMWAISAFRASAPLRIRKGWNQSKFSVGK